MISEPLSHSGADRRRYPRINACIEYAVLDQSRPAKLFGTKNISAGGIAFFSKEKLEKNTLVSLSVTLPDTSDFRATAGVVWCEEARLSWDPSIGYEVGVNLIEIREADRQKITRYVFSRLDKD